MKNKKRIVSALRQLSASPNHQAKNSSIDVRGCQAIKAVGERLFATKGSHIVEGKLLNDGSESSSRVGNSDDEE